jgi:hypothetical protein
MNNFSLFKYHYSVINHLSVAHMYGGILNDGGGLLRKGRHDDGAP